MNLVIKRICFLGLTSITLIFMGIVYKTFGLVSGGILMFLGLMFLDHIFGVIRDKDGGLGEQHSGSTTAATSPLHLHSAASGGLVSWSTCFFSC